MAEIILTSGNVTTVDDDMYPLLSKWNWWENHNGYAYRQERKGNKRTGIFLHRIVNNTPIGEDTDHINRDKLDNRRANLRTVSRSKNMLNINPTRANTSGVKGVNWFKRANKWRAYITIDGKQKSLGYFTNISDAKQSRLNAEKIYGL